MNRLTRSFLKYYIRNFCIAFLKSLTKENQSEITKFRKHEKNSRSKTTYTEGNKEIIEMYKTHK